ncbi:MAG TPA: tyrosine/phenylalanine carboxypeptidase domain-containing protein, partial [Polyangiales bacterium]
VECQLPAETAIMTAERAYRGGGVARDAGYLAGFLRVRAALTAGRATLDELRRGRVTLAHVARLRELEREGWVTPARYRPSLALSRSLTFGGTSADTSPPSEAASLTMLELT